MSEKPDKFNLGDVSASARVSSLSDDAGCVPKYVEEGFRWMRETIELIHTHKKHPLPMVALMFMYMETLGKPLAVAAGKRKDTDIKVCAFVELYMPKLWAAFAAFPKRQDILGNHYRNGLAHEIFMKNNAGIHRGGTDYVLKASGIPYSINIDFLVPEFIQGLDLYYKRLTSDSDFFKSFDKELGDGKQY